MAVNYQLPTPASLLPVPGVTLGFAEAHVRKPNRKDMLVVAFEAGTLVAGVFTQNRFCAAPVLVCREHLNATHDIRALVINTGCANAGTGERGLTDAKTMAAEVAAALDCKPNQVLPFSLALFSNICRWIVFQQASPSASRISRPRVGLMPRTLL